MWNVAQGEVAGVKWVRSGCQSRPGAGLTNEDRLRRVTGSATNFKPMSSFYDMQPEKRID